MKKRIFIPVSFGFILLVLFFFALAVLGSISCVYCFLGLLEDIDRFYSIFILIGVIFVFYTAFRFLFAFKIHLRKEDVATFGDGLPKIEKIQYRTFVKYVDITNIVIIASEKDSRNKKIRARWISSSMPKKYLEFTLTNGKQTRMCIHYYTKWQVVKMLNCISHNMQISGDQNKLDVNEIMKDYYAYDGYNRDDLRLKRGERLPRKKEKYFKEIGFYDLKKDLQIKFIRLFNAKVKCKYSDYLTIEEFCEVLDKVNLKYYFSYNNKFYHIEKNDSNILVYEDTNEESLLMSSFESPQNLIDNLKIENMEFRSLWQEILKSKKYINWGIT